MLSFTFGVLVAGALIAAGAALGGIAVGWHHDRYRSKVDEQGRKAYADAYQKAHSEIIEKYNLGVKKADDLKRSELPRSGEEDMVTYEQSLRNMNYPPDKIDELLKRRRKV